MNLRIGTKVHYIPYEGCDPSLYENGVIKSHTDDLTHVFVVYNCAGEWENYQNYTAARTSINQLKPGWV